MRAETKSPAGEGGAWGKGKRECYFSNARASSSLINSRGVPRPCQRAADGFGMHLLEGGGLVNGEHGRLLTPQTRPAIGLVGLRRTFQNRARGGGCRRLPVGGRLRADVTPKAHHLLALHSALKRRNHRVGGGDFAIQCPVSSRHHHHDGPFATGLAGVEVYPYCLAHLKRARMGAPPLGLLHAEAVARRCQPALLRKVARTLPAAHVGAVVVVMPEHVARGGVRFASRR